MLNIPSYHGCLSINKDLNLPGMKQSTHERTQCTHHPAVQSLVTHGGRYLTKAGFTLTQQRQRSGEKSAERLR